MTKKEKESLTSQLESIHKELRTSMVSWCIEKIEGLIEQIKDGNLATVQVSPQRKVDAPHHEPGMEPTSPDPLEVSGKDSMDPFSDWED